MWDDDILIKVFSRIKYDSKMQDFKTKYKDFTFTTETVSAAKPKFPTFLLQQLETPEIGQDLENSTINAVNAGFQIEVIDNQDTKERIKEIKSEAKKIMKSMKFNITNIPDAETNDEKRVGFRATRIMGQGDIL